MHGYDFKTLHTRGFKYRWDIEIWRFCASRSYCFSLCVLSTTIGRVLSIAIPVSHTVFAECSIVEGNRKKRKRTPTIAISYMGTAIKHSVPDRVKQSFVIFDIRALWRSGLKVTVAGCQKLQMTAVLQTAKVAQNVNYCVKCYIFHQAHVIGTWKQSLQKSQSVYTVCSQLVTQQPVE